MRPLEIHNLFSCAEQPKTQTLKYLYSLQSRFKLDVSGMCTLQRQQMKCTRTRDCFWLLQFTPEWSALKRVGQFCTELCKIPATHPHCISHFLIHYPTATEARVP